MPEQPATTFGLIRHAPTQWNNEKRIQGQLDIPLTGRGRMLAVRWGGQLAEDFWQSILCSDLQRTRETAALINRSLDLPILEHSMLREQDWGEWSGLTLAELSGIHRKDLHNQERRGWLFTPPGGESRQEVLARALSVLETEHRRSSGQPVLVVCHEGVIKCLLYHLARRQFLPGEPRIIEPYRLHLLEMRDSTLWLQSLNHKALARETDHDG